MGRPFKTASYQTGPLLIEELYNSSLIQAPIASFYLSNDASSQSFCDLGFYDISEIKSQQNDKIAWINMP
jgi:hypothetical protein